ncbi:hypothetical protein KIM372_14900 [Bombiscardovia nodaiensis]|uniref:Addiction module antidote protein n=1 Tax=Bombiscardovia nodaiensis TaxID=2932181 RepID=A0ABM8B9K3_9BIFI|nr:hypothetical protein KIM372_14900 [Bombiscardovia nodaiensis]
MTAVSEFRPEDYLQTEEEISDYLSAALEEANELANPRDGAAFFARALGTAARARKKVSDIAQDTQRTRQGVYKSLSAHGDPAFSTVLGAMHALGGQFEVTFPSQKHSAGV